MVAQGRYKWPLGSLGHASDLRWTSLNKHDSTSEEVTPENA